MFKRFYPYAYVDSVFAINYQKLYNMGYRGLIFDIDNTLVHHGDDSTPEIDDLFFRIQKMGFKTLLLSNNTEERIESFLKNIDSLYIHDARKPEKAGYEKAAEMLGIEKEKIMFIGDQVFTDILGANRCGLDSILVKFIRIDNNAPIGKMTSCRKYNFKILQKK